jgi:hypothetical protein
MPLCACAYASVCVSHLFILVGFTFIVGGAVVAAAMGAGQLGRPGPTEHRSGALGTDPHGRHVREAAARTHRSAHVLSVRPAPPSVPSPTTQEQAEPRHGPSACACGWLRHGERLWRARWTSTVAGGYGGWQQRRQVGQTVAIVAVCHPQQERRRHGGQGPRQRARALVRRSRRPVTHQHRHAATTTATAIGRPASTGAVQVAAG